jgi:hypothetical protein
VELYLRAYAPSNVEGDDFDFTYSVNGGPALAAGTTINGAAAVAWTIPLPNDTVGTVVVRVVDTDPTVGNGGSDTLTVYEMHVTSAGPATDQPPVVAISEPGDGIMIGEGTELVFSATVTDEDTNLVAGLSWSSEPEWLTGSGANIAATLPMGEYVVTASAMDSASLPGADSVSVVVVLDVTAPVVTVLGDNPASVVVGGSYVDAGATAADLVDGDLTAAIATGGLPIDTSTAGTYFVTYAVSDVAGNTGQASRTVNVVEAGSLLAVTEIIPSSISRYALPAGVQVTITGTGFTASSVVTFQNGSGPTPSATDVTLVGADLIATVSGSSGGPKKLRYWDVVVTNSGGVNAVCAGCLTISP